MALIETIVDRLADILESVGMLLDKLSRDIFKRRQNKPAVRSIAAWQRELLERVAVQGICVHACGTLCWGWNASPFF